MTHNIIILCIWFFLSSYMFQTSTSLDSLAVSQSIRDGETLVLAGGITKVGFFSPGNSTRRYLGIWYTNVYPSTVSFDYPCDMLMLGMKLGWNLEMGLERSLSSWKSVNDPVEGEYTLKLDLEGYPHAVIHKGPEIKIRKGPWNGHQSDGFLKYKHMKLPDTSSSWFSKTMNLEDCKKLCLENCSCVAYANLDMRGGGSGCLLWFSNLVYMRKFSQWGQDIYVRLPASKLAANGNLKKKIVGITVGVTIFGLIITCVCILILKNSGAARKIYGKHYKSIQRKEDIDLPNFNLSVLAKATENFSTKNKLGEGGFGQVYKKIAFQGTLRDDKELVVKRLPKKSGQGLDELKTEVVLIAKLQHRKLVKLLGCCIEGEEKLLIYEYMANQSLDYFIFDWSRYNLF
ncbi:G-type lectin S-receptor-like serine/threonine-protein kinase SD1-1 [Glycine soja]|uniref:G-type lectin S-receptor-like serine/threonine-protein kinase SD1-1 n=1 Tax=Glycine soja TaxID=3848 RepID=A0A0B2SR89_GLYSO|nr:G-type lectin S-receptor-like serine/threonine-protein kinase SD1-1 [Glycine soja]